MSTSSYSMKIKWTKWQRHIHVSVISRETYIFYRYILTFLFQIICLSQKPIFSRGLVYHNFMSYVSGSKLQGRTNECGSRSRGQIVDMLIRIQNTADNLYSDKWLSTRMIYYLPIVLKRRHPAWDPVGFIPIIRFSFAIKKSNAKH